MPRYRKITSRSAGGYDEFTADNDTDALEYANRYLFGARLIELGEIQIRAGGDLFRKIPIPKEPS